MNGGTRNGYFDANRSAGGQSSQGLSSDSNGSLAGTSMAARPLAPKYQSLLDLERIVDPNQAESLKILRLGHRTRHRILASPQDYFQRNLLIPTALRAFLQNLWTAFFLLTLWTWIAGWLDILFAHCFLKTQRSLFQDLTGHFQLFPHLFHLPTFLAAFLISAAATWNYLQLVRIPPPLFRNRTEKLLEFLQSTVRTLRVPGVLVFSAVLFLRPSFVLQHSSADLPATSSSVLSSDGAVVIETVTTSSLSDVFLWEIVLKTLVPTVYLLAVFASANFVHFWLGDFFIGVVKVQRHAPSLLKIKNLFVFLQQLFLSLTSLLSATVLPGFVFPGRNFWKMTFALFFLPFFFPVADVFRVWLHFHFLSFGIVNVWKFSVLEMRKSLSCLHYFGHLTFSEWIFLPTVLEEVKKTEWGWSQFLEMHLRSAFFEQLKNQPNFLSAFFSLRIPTKDLNQLESFVQFWLSPIQEFSQKFHAVTFLEEVQEEPRSRRMDFVLWMVMQLQSLHDHYASDHSPNLLDQDFTAFPFAHLAQTTVKTIELIRGISLFALRAKSVDTRNILASNYSRILEQVAALSVILENVGKKKFEDLTDGRLFLQCPNMEPCIRFYVKSYRQLERITRLNLTELAVALVSDVSELHFKDYPELVPYVGGLLQQTKER